MSTTVEDIVKVIEVLQQRPAGSLAMFENTLAEICEYLEQIASAAQRPAPQFDGASIGQSIADALRGLQITAPAVTVEAPVTVMGPAPAPVTPWLLSVASYDGNGKANSWRFTPEK